MGLQLRLLIKRLDMQEVQHTLLQNIDVLRRLNPVPPRHLLYWSFLVQLCPPRYGITTILFDLSEPIRALQVHPELRSGIESLSQPLCRFRRNCPLAGNQLTYQTGRPPENLCKFYLAPSTRLDFLPNELTRRKHLSRSSIHYLHDHHLSRFIQW